MSNQNPYPAGCIICGTSFPAFRAHAKYCSPACKRSALLVNRQANPRPHRHVRRCPRCGQTFTARRVEGTYCSNACRQAVHRRRHLSSRTA